MKTVKVRLVELRKIHGKTQSEVANHLEITRPAYTNYETGKREPNIETINKLADYFDVTVDSLLGRETLQKGADISDDDIKAALFGDDSDATDEMLEAVRSYAAFLSERQKKKNAGADGKNDDKNK